MSNKTVAELADLVGGQLEGDGSRTIEGVGDLRSAEAYQIAFVRDEAWYEVARQSNAGVLLVPEHIEGAKSAQIIAANVDASFARIAGQFHPVPRATEHRVHETAAIAEDVEIESPVDIGPHVAVGRGSRIGAGTILRAGTVVGELCVIGHDCMLHARVVLYDGTLLGDRVILHSGVVLGADGFGYAEDNGALVKIPQIGNVQLDSDVEIGANTTIDRGALGPTRIGRGTKIDNLCQIAHNCVFGEDVGVAAFSAFSGSTRLGDRVRIGGHVISGGHLKVVADTKVGGNSAIQHGIGEPGEFMGYPLLPIADWARTLQMLRKLTTMRGLFRRERRSQDS